MPQPSIPATDRQTTHNPSPASVGPFSVNFAIAELDDLEVYQDGVLVDPDDYLVAGTLGDYSLYESATVTLDTAFAGRLDILGARGPNRTEQFQEGTGVPARDSNKSFNRQAIEIRETFEKARRALVL